MAITTSASTTASRGRPSVLTVLRWEEVLEHYQHRVTIHRRLLKLHAEQKIVPFARLLVGVSDPRGNYSANEHGLGPLILSESENPNSAQRLFDVASKLRAVKKGQEVPNVIRSAALKYFKIGVGSEASCMVNPNVCWVANTRTIWASLVFKPDGNVKLADEELELYRNEDDTSEMAYRKAIAHPAPASVSPGRLADITKRTVSNTEARLAFAVLTTERKAA